MARIKQYPLDSKEHWPLDSLGFNGPSDPKRKDLEAVRQKMADVVEGRKETANVRQTIPKKKRSKKTVLRRKKV